MQLNTVKTVNSMLHVFYHNESKQGVIAPSIDPAELLRAGNGARRRRHGASGAACLLVPGLCAPAAWRPLRPSSVQEPRSSRRPGGFGSLRLSRLLGRIKLTQEGRVLIFEPLQCAKRSARHTQMHSEAVPQRQHLGQEPVPFADERLRGSLANDVLKILLHPNRV